MHKVNFYLKIFILFYFFFFLKKLKKKAIIERLLIYDYYEAYKIIGMGAYGVVCSGKNNLTNQFVAIKKVF